MASQQIMWTAVPGGFSALGRLRLSVHVSPRLTPNAAQGTLAEFPDFLSWPSVAFGQWIVEFDNSPRAITAQVVTAPASAASRWNALFNASTPVDQRRFDDFTQRKVYSYPRQSLTNLVRETYAQVAVASPDAFPPRAMLSGLRQLLGDDHGRTAANQVEAAVTANKAIPPRAPDAGFDFARFRRYHTPPAKRLPGPADSATVPRFDVHAMWSIAQDHPALLRRLGLVIDLELDEYPPAGASAVRVRPQWTPQLTSSIDVRPFTRCVLAAGTFRAADPPAGDCDSGFLRLDDAARFAVETFDVDGAAFKLLDVANALDPADAKPSIDTPQQLALASLRAMGLGVYRLDRAHWLREQRWVRGKALDAQLLSGSPPGSNVYLDASDLVQGARFDVQANPSSAVAVWRSLMSRSTTYDFTAAAGTTDTVSFDEASAAEAGTSAPGSGATGDFYLGESMMLWDGWTLGAPRPGKVVENDDKVHEPDNSVPQGGLPLVISHRAVPGSLERLRFGTTYRFRARAVDIAGNALPPSDASAARATAPAFFGRFEPVAAPALLRRTGSTPGDTAERVVLRSNFDVPASPPTEQRHLVAPKVAQQTCELHGRFDAMNAAAAYAFITSREAKVLEDVPGAQPDARDAGSFVVNADSVVAPYLPDPLAVGVVLRNVAPGAAGDVSVPFAGTWPDLPSSRLVIEEAPAGDLGSVITDTQGVVRVRLPKAARRKVKVSSLPDTQLLNVSGLWNWLVERGTASAQLAALIGGGQHWMFTPFRELELVHAVKQPLVPPVFDALRAVRNPGETFTAFDGVAQFNRPSTARIDLEASWTEFHDDGPGAPAPSRPDENGAGFLDTRQGSGVVTLPVGEGLPDASNRETVFMLQELAPPVGRHTFQDTRHRTVQYLSRGFSAFDDFFRAERAVDFSGGATQTLEALGVVTGSVRLQSTPGDQNKASWSEGADFTVDAAAGTVTRTQGSMMPARVQASWVPRPNDRVAPSAIEVNVPSSARPAAPRVKYIVPTFSAMASGSGLAQTRTRTGGGLRVYLDRPWWSSGADEQLGVVMRASPLAGQASLPPAEALVCTQWGVDPVHFSAPTADAVTPGAFPLKTSTGVDLQVAEAEVRLSVAGHAVGFDATRDLWYCDLQVEAGDSYFPFIRLALARYQPSSLPGLELSPVVLADFMQLPAGRTVSIAPFQQMVMGGGEGMNVAVGGPTFDASANDPRPPRVTVTIQRRIAGIPGELGWEDLGSPADLQVSRAKGSSTFATGAVMLPGDVPRADLRLLFREYEQLREDGLAPGDPATWAERPVWAEIIELS